MGPLRFDLHTHSLLTRWHGILEVRILPALLQTCQLSFLSASLYYFSLSYLAVISFLLLHFPCISPLCLSLVSFRDESRYL